MLALPDRLEDQNSSTVNGSSRLIVIVRLRILFAAYINELWGQAPFPLYTTYLHTFELGYALSTPESLFVSSFCISFKIRLRSRFPYSPIVPRFVLAFPDLRRRAHSHPCYSPGDFQIYSWKPIVPRFVFAKTKTCRANIPRQTIGGIHHDHTTSLRNNKAQQYER